MSRRIAITGAGRGIGLELTRQLVAQGHEVWASCRNPATATELADIGPAGVLTLDIGDAASITTFAGELATKVDGLDTLINNAGITARELGVDRMKQNPLETTPEVVMGQIEVNAIGPMLLTQALRPLLGKGTDPLVLNLSSQLGSMVIAAKMPFDLGYSASKAVVNMMTVMSASADPDITYVAMHPGYVQTDMSGPKAAMTVPDCGSAIVETLATLTSEDSGRFIRWDGTDHPW